MEENTSILISVIIPIFNTEKYLYKCIDSLYKQTLRNIEFILINDGSTDKSLEICKKIIGCDNRFKLINQQNSGSAVARQVGLDAAQGEYVIVCDSDDWVESNMYEILYLKAISTFADIVTCGFNNYYPDGRTESRVVLCKEENGIVDNDDFAIRGSLSSCNKLIKRSFLNDCHISYQPGINLGEDAFIMYKILRCNPKIVQIEDCLYNYRRRFGENSYTNQITMDRITQLEEIYKWLKENYSDSKFDLLRRKRAQDIAFAYLRATDTEKIKMDAFLSAEIIWKDFFKDGLSLKKLIIYSEKILPLSFSKYLYSKLYPLFYR